MNLPLYRSIRACYPTLTLAAALLLIVFALCLPVPISADQRRSGRSKNAILVLVDGLRWQEVFTGADETLMNRESGGVPDPGKLRASFWRETPEARRQVLMPFLWSVVARQGQLFGNQRSGSIAKVTNSFHFSYPGYSEMIVGYADPRIDSNAKRPNPNVTVFEWLHRKPAYQGRVAVFGAWDTVAWIVNRERCGFFVNVGYEPVTAGKITPRQELLNQLKVEMPQVWDGEPFDAITVRAAVEYLKANHPRALWLTLGETDEWAHEGRYDRYLDAARRTDGFLRTIWETTESLPQYRGKTTLIVVVDHGRGHTAQGWKSHGNRIPGSDDIWVAILGPNTPALGERASVPPVTQSQIAATLAAALGEDYCADVPTAAPPIREAFRR
jgi:hypothetical protein